MEIHRTLLTGILLVFEDRTPSFYCLINLKINLVNSGLYKNVEIRRMVLFDV